ncbi:MAG: hypothetical protein ACREAZ_00265 [Nitrososphaera sp.]
MFTPEDLVEKLVAVGAVQRIDGELRFTERLCGYLANCNPGQYLRAGEVKGWRIMLRYFDPSLDSLSDVEISKTIVLFEYFLRNAEKNRKTLVSSEKA